MEKEAISIHADLAHLILQLRESKDNQEMALKESFKNFAHALSPVEVAKSTLHELVKDKEVQFDLVKGGMNLGANYFISSVFNQQGSFKGFLNTLVLEKLSSTFIQANAGQIIIGVAGLFSKKQDQRK